MLTSAIDAAGFYAAINIILLVALAYNVTRHRRRAQVSLGIGDDPGLEQACRAHANGVEYVPIGLIALFGLALMSGPAWAVHIAGGALTAGRFLHAQGLLSKPGVTFGRFAGTLLTFLSLVGSSAGLIWLAVF